MPADDFSLRRIAIPAFAPTFLFGLGEGAILPVVALSVRQLGGSVALAALMVTLIGIGSLVTNIPASLITTRYGERWALVGAAVWGAAGMLLCALVQHLGAFAVGVFMIGMANSVFSLARQSYLTEAVPFHYRARALSTLGGVIRIGLFIGPFPAAALIHVVGLSGGYWIGVAGLLLAAVVALRVPDLPGEPSAGSEGGATGGSATTIPDAAGGTARRRRPAPTTTIRSVALAHRRILLTIGIGILLVSAVRASRQAVLPLWAEQIGLDAAVTALIYGLAGGIEMLVFLPAGRVMDRRGRLWVAVPCTVLMGVALFFIPFTHSDTTLLMAALLLGFGNGIGSGLVMTLGADYSPSPGRAHFLGVWRLMADLGSTGGPALLSAVTAATALSAAIWCTALVAFAAAGVLGHFIPRTRIRGRPEKNDAT